jgi:phospholipase/carboxylesterase
MVTRRRFLALGIGASVSVGGGAIGCASVRTDRAAGEPGRLLARPGQVSAGRPQPLSGEQRLSLGTDRDGLLYVPRELSSSPAPLLLLLHGARGGARGVTSRVGAFALADQFKIVVLAPDSRDGTWDVIRGGAFGSDVTFLDTALDHVFARLQIDPARVAIGGFSDGASYALSLGLINGDLFTHVIAFSPGFLVADHAHGRPAIFVSHGTNDEILPIDSTSRRLVPALRDAGYTVQFREFAGPHTVPASIAREAFEWMNGTAATTQAAPRSS